MAETLSELKKIEEEIKELKMIMLKSQAEQKKPVAMKGLLKDSRIEEKDIQEAKKSLFRQTED